MANKYRITKLEGCDKWRVEQWHDPNTLRRFVWASRPWARAARSPWQPVQRWVIGDCWTDIECNSEQKAKEWVAHFEKEDREDDMRREGRWQA